MTGVLDCLERVKAKLMFAVVSGHDFIPVGRVMGVVNKITKLLGHVRPLPYDPPYKADKVQAKVWDALDAAHRELKDLLMTQKKEVVASIGEEKWSDFYNLLAEIVSARDKAYDKEHGPGASLLKRGRKFNVASVR